MSRFRRAPDKPTDLSKRSWFGTLKRTGKEFSHDNLTDWAAALTYYAVLSVFPAISRWSRSSAWSSTRRRSRA